MSLLGVDLGTSGCKAAVFSEDGRRLSLAFREYVTRLPRPGWMELDARLGRCVPCGATVGRISGAMARELRLPAGVALVSGGHDQALCALGAGCTGAGSAVCGLGTFACLTPVFDRIPDATETLPAGLCVEHHVLPGRYVSFLFNQSGSLVTWFRSACAAGSDGQDRQDLYRRLFAEMPEGPTALIALPTFEPLQFPAYAGDVSGAILGLGPGTTRGEILKALLEGAAYYFLPGLDTLRRFGIQTREFVATGGGSRSDAWLQLEADVFGTPFVRLENEEAGLAGAAMLAGLGTGRFADPAEAARRFVRRGRTFVPDAGRHAAYRDRAACFRTILDTLRPAFPALRALRTGDKRDRNSNRISVRHGYRPGHRRKPSRKGAVELHGVHIFSRKSVVGGW